MQAQVNLEDMTAPSMAGTIIYKKTKTGATQQWHQEIQGGMFRTVSGQVGGKLITSEWTVCEATNVGRANERDLEAQAFFEVEANYKHKLDKDYHLTLDKIEEGAHILPCMLAYAYSDAILRKNPPILSECFSQPKLDGMRCLINRHGMWTRNGKPITSCPHIFKALKFQFTVTPDLVMDGELYNMEFAADFNSLMSILKKMKPTDEELVKSEKFAQYHTYDIAMISDKTFSQRSKDLKEIVHAAASPYIQYVRTDKIIDAIHLDHLYFNEYLAAGYEGQIIREDAVYVGSRTWSLLKRKEFFDKEYILVDIEPGLGNWAGKGKRSILKTEDGREFGAGITGTMEFCEELLKNKEKYIGKMTTVNYTNLTPDGIPRFGRTKEIGRLDI